MEPAVYQHSISWSQVLSLVTKSFEELPGKSKGLATLHVVRLPLLATKLICQCLESMRKPSRPDVFKYNSIKVIYFSLITFELRFEDEPLVVSVWCFSVIRAQ